MARNTKDDLLMEDELAAAFLEDDGETSLVGDEASPTPEQNLPSETDGWEESETEGEDFPGQLAVDVYETKDKLIVKARTAGIAKQDLDVTVQDNILTVSGILSGGEEEEGVTWHAQECYWGAFSRTIALPVEVKEDGVEADLKDGVLTIKFEKNKAKTIVVTVN